MTVVADFIDYLRVDCGYSATTLRTYRSDLEALERWLGGVDESQDLTTVDRDLIRRWVASEGARGVKPQTIKRMLSSLRTFFKYLLRQGLITTDPMRLVSNPKLPRPLPAFVRENEMDRLLDHTAFPDNFAGRRDHLILLTFYTTGMRLSELVGLDVDSFSWPRSEVKVLGKRNKHRVIPFGPELYAHLQTYLGERRQVCGTDDGPFFVDGEGRRLTAPKVRETVKHYLGLVTTSHKRTPHVLRHTFATAMLNNGADLEAVKDLLGHESVATTQIYTHATFNELRQAYLHAHPRATSDE